MSHLIQEYPLKKNIGSGIFLTTILGACSFFMVYMALTNDRGLDFKGIIFSQENAIIFYWVFAAICFALMILFVIIFYYQLKKDLSVRIFDDSIIFPHGMKKNDHQIYFNNIQSIQLRSVSGQDMIEIISTESKKKYNITKAFLGKENFEHLLNLLLDSLSKNSKDKVN